MEIIERVIAMLHPSRCWDLPAVALGKSLVAHDMLCFSHPW